MNTLIMPKYLLLDLDNTAYAYEACHNRGLTAAHGIARSLAKAWQTDSAFHAAYAEARRTVKARVGKHATAHCRLHYFKELLDSLGQGSHFEALSQLHDAYWRGYFEAMRRDEDCLEVLTACRATGMKLVWVTNFTTERQILKLQALGLTEITDGLITSEEAGAEKPDPQEFFPSERMIV